jgi:hypothetical protein
VESLPESHPLRRLFAGTVQQVFYAEIGMCDPQIADYVVDLLSSLVHADDFFPFHRADGTRLKNLAEWTAEAELPSDVSQRQRDRLVHRHIGDFTLFWSGLFPEGLRRLRHAGVGERLNDYLGQGKRSYAIASELTRPADDPPAGVLQRLSERFEYCVYGLNLCRKEWQVLGDQGPSNS